MPHLGDPQTRHESDTTQTQTPSLFMHEDRIQGFCPPHPLPLLYQQVEGERAIFSAKDSHPIFDLVSACPSVKAEGAKWKA